MSVTYDSDGKQELDTLTISERFYNGLHKIVLRRQETPRTGDVMEIEYVYNEENRIVKEIVHLLNEGLKSEVKYIYRDTLVHKTEAIVGDDELFIKQTAEYAYYPNNQLRQQLNKTLSVDLTHGDTLTHSIERFSYDQKGTLYESSLNNLNRPSGNHRMEYVYEGDELQQLKKYTTTDSLVQQITYTYQFDSHNNWVERKHFENDSLRYLISRKYTYH